MIINGDCLSELDKLQKNSVDAIVTDPPYELNFMGKGWDNAGVSFNKETWEKCLRVLKPGGYLLAFGGTRTYHRIACAIEDAGFEIRDCIMWLYGSGFPKSMDISKQIDKRPNRSYENLNLFSKKLKEQRELKGYSKNQIDEMMGTNTAYAWWEGRNYLGEFKIQLPDKDNYKKLKEILELNDDMDFIFEEAEREVIGTKQSRCFNSQEKDRYTIGSSKTLEVDITIPSTDLAKQWQGWGTALKPSFEPIIVARKPFKGSLVDNVIEYGVGGINIDECRVPLENGETKHGGFGQAKTGFQKGIGNSGDKDYKCEWVENTQGRFPANTILTYDETDFDEVCGGFPITGKESSSRYFYCAKASKKDRDEGLSEDARNIHPTVKPTSLMQYLVRLVSPKGATILDPFMGSGSTGKAVAYENMERNADYKFIGIELDPQYCKIAEARIEAAK